MIFTEVNKIIHDILDFCWVIVDVQYDRLTTKFVTELVTLFRVWPSKRHVWMIIGIWVIKATSIWL